MDPITIKFIIEKTKVLTKDICKISRLSSSEKELDNLLDIYWTTFRDDVKILTKINYSIPHKDIPRKDIPHKDIPRKDIPHKDIGFDIHPLSGLPDMSGAGMGVTYGIKDFSDTVGDNISELLIFTTVDDASKYIYKYLNPSANTLATIRSKISKSRNGKNIKRNNLDPYSAYNIEWNHKAPVKFEGTITIIKSR